MPEPARPQTTRHRPAGGQAHPARVNVTPSDHVAGVTYDGREYHQHELSKDCWCKPTVAKIEGKRRQTRTAP